MAFKKVKIIISYNQDFQTNDYDIKGLIVRNKNGDM